MTLMTCLQNVQAEVLKTATPGEEFKQSSSHLDLVMSARDPDLIMGGSASLNISRNSFLLPKHIPNVESLDVVNVMVRIVFCVTYLYCILI